MRASSAPAASPLNSRPMTSPVPHADACVLVTGANGFIGTHSVLHLESLGCRVVPVDVAPRSPHLSLLPVATPSILMDITDAPAFAALCRDNDVTHVMHLAYPGRGSDAEVLGFCVQAMRNILDAATTLALRRVVFASSGAVYGRILRGTPIREDEPVQIHPTFAYRSVKILGEWMGAMHARQSGTGFVALRLASVYGPGVAIGMGAALTRGVLGGPCRPYLTRSPIDDPLHASDAARALGIACFHDSPPSLAYNIGSGVPWGDEDMARAIRRHLPEIDFEIGTHHDPEAQAFRQRDILDMTRAREELGFAPAHDLESGIAAMAGWLRENRSRLA